MGSINGAYHISPGREKNFPASSKVPAKEIVFLDSTFSVKILKIPECQKPGE
jgi:hypothetical protein